MRLKLLVFVLVFVLTGLLCVVGLEVALRIQPALVDRLDPGYFSDYNWFSFDPHVEYVLKRNYLKTFSYQVGVGQQRSVEIRTNSDGYRDVDFAAKRARSGLHVAAIGDSFTEGYHVRASDTWPAQLEQILGPDSAVFNLGVHNYSAIQYYLTAKYKLQPIEPDVVVIGLYAFNDIVEYMDLHLLDAFWEKDSAIRLRQAWRVWQAARQRAATGSSASPQTAVTAADPPELERCVFPDPSQGDPTYRRNYFSYYRGWTWQHDSRHPTFRKSIEETLPFIKALLDANNGRTLILIFPTREQSNDRWWDTSKCLFGFTDGDRFALQRELVNKVNSDRLIDLSEDFLAAQSQRTYLDFDGHWDTAGHLVAASAAADAIRRLGWDSARR